MCKEPDKLRQNLALLNGWKVLHCPVLAVCGWYHMEIFRTVDERGGAAKGDLIEGYNG